MKEIKNREQLNSFMRAYKIDCLFNPQLMPHLKLYQFNRGENICSQGEPSEYLYVLVKGKVKVFTTSPEGKTLILSFKTPLELIGDIEYVRGTDTVNTVEAVSPVTMIGVHQRWLKKYASEDSAFLQFLLKIITDKFYVKSNSLRFNLLYPVEVRLASYLLSVSFDESNSLLTGQHSAGSLKDAANLIGTSYRHMNRVIRQFCNEGLVDRNSKGILVKDREGLRRLANDNIYE
ncbi:Crp/Fnr family transcriptional regulator [Fictibacillus terranigra]|uniref:Cyclic nucleotide-binding domain-containing protein n=1 Tax=Fictibacillus terranigra TaxID=3058424 RepID=A0ABT8E850_9BACL|nr:cyclic nucleotide-binding domain-containing protein [Fictibacillus sp. CENA-BCM004]MDN4074080.1 cyclic nucleotide-binding domain-containing protein [Fictibacillus sp. CENA-BCM004]